MSDKEKDEVIIDEVKEDEYENICISCKRPESKTGRQLNMGQGIHMCVDCMEKVCKSCFSDTSRPIKRFIKSRSH